MLLNTRGDSVNVYPAPAVVPGNIYTAGPPLFQIFSYSISREHLDAWNGCWLVSGKEIVGILYLFIVS
jgi:hypothetical protein